MRRILLILLLCGSASAQVYTDFAPHFLTGLTSSPAPFVVTESGDYSGFIASKIFDGLLGNGNGWIMNTTGTCWFEIDLGSGNAYNLLNYTLTPHEAVRMPKTWILEGSNNNSTWTTVDSQTNITSWVDDTAKNFTAASPGTYRYFRLTSSANNGDATYTSVIEAYFFTTESSWAKNSLPPPTQVCNVNGTVCTFTNNVTSGNTIYVGAHRGGTLSTPTDTRTTTWTLIDSSVASPIAIDSYLWCGVLGSGGAEAITITSADGIIAMEYPATAGFTCTKDASKNGTSGGVTPYAPDISTSQNGDFLVCYLVTTDSGMEPIPHEGGAFVSASMQNGASTGSLAYRYGALAGSEFCPFDNVDNPAGRYNTAYIYASFQASAITIMTTALPSGATTKSYSYTLQAIGGAGAYTWSVSSGTLPSGLSLSSAGVITGTPTGGTQTLTFQVTDGTHTTTKSLTLTVNSSVGAMSMVSQVSIASGASTGSLGTVTTGNCIMAAIEMGRFPIYPPTDSLGTTFKYAGLHYSPQGIGWTFWYGVATSTGSDTLTTLTSHSGTLAVQIANCQGFADVSAADAGINGGSVTLNGTALTTLAPGSQIWSAVVGQSAGSTWTAGTGFSTSGDASLANCCQGINATESSTGTYTPSFVQSGNAGGNWVIWDIALRPSTSGVVNTNHRRAWVIER